MNKLLLFIGLALLSWGSSAQIRFTMVDPTNAQITIRNFGMMGVDIQQYRLCALFEYASLSSGNVTVTSGSLNLAGGASVTINWNANSGFNTAASDLGLYLPMGSFADEANMVDFMQYGDFGQGREGVAQQAGLWVAGTFLPGTGPWMYTGNGTDSTIVFWMTAGGAGCTAPAACNYDPTATEDDGSCLFEGLPCDDGNPQTIDVIDANCICTGILTGCTNPLACNYNPDAVDEDFSCLFPGEPCDDDNIFTEGDAYTAECVCQGEEIAGIPGCLSADACNYDLNATIDDGSCIFPGEPCDDNNENTFEDVYTAECVCAGLTLGCTLNNACNFDASAGIDDGSCMLPGDNCDDGDPFTNNDVYGLDCVCAGEPPVSIEGCTAPEACNYNPDANVEDFSCLLPGEPCDDGNEATVNDLLGGDCVCAGLITGCTELGTCNYNENAIVDDGSCFFPGDNCDDDNAATIDDVYNADCVCEGVIPQIEGCTATEACNFNPAANVEDGSCELPGYPCDDNNALTIDDSWSGDCTCTGLLTGCTDMMACNYNADAFVDDFSCVFPNDPCDDNDITTNGDAYTAECICAGEDNGLIAGCMEMGACNYDANATIDDGSCIIIGSDCDDADEATTNDVIQTDCSCAGTVVTIIEGCTAPEACNFNPEANVDNGECTLPGEPCDDMNEGTINDLLNADCVCTGETLGCTETNACNYNMEAVSDDGSCLFPGDNCNDENIFTIDDVYNTDCVCTGTEITGTPGCTATEACNYNPEATIEDFSCILPGESCDDLNDATINDIYTADCLCMGEVTGCMEISACNYNAAAVIDDGSCFFVGDACDDNDLTTSTDVITAECVCLGEDNGLIAGCMDMNACNYDMATTIDDGSCFAIGDMCDDGDMFTANDMINADCICAGEAIVIVEGCTAIEACNFDPAANFDNGTCELPGFPCDDNNPNTINDALGADCVCAGMIVGCTDMSACNYNPDAVFDDFSCEFPGSPCNDGNDETLNDVLDNNCDCIGTNVFVLGCTDIDACNYDSSANTDDGSCYFVGDSCDDGNANTSNDVYNANCLCEGVVSVEEISAFYSVYPNPTNGLLTIAQQQGASIQLIEVVDITGKRVATFNPNASMTTIDLSAFAQGLYTLNIRSNNEVKSVRVQKN